MQTPNITQAQIAAIVAAVGAVLAIINQADDRLQIPLLALIGVLGLAWIVSDAIVRHGRAGVAAAQHVEAAAEITAAAATAHLDQGDLPDAPTK